MTKATINIDNGFLARVSALATSTMSGNKNVALAGAFNSENSVAVNNAGATPDGPNAL